MLTEFDWLHQDLPSHGLQSWFGLSFGPTSTARKEQMYTHTPVRVELWDVEKDIEDYISNADKVKREHWKIDFFGMLPEFAATLVTSGVVDDICRFLNIKHSGSSVDFVEDACLELPPEYIAEGGNSTNLDESKNDDRDVQKCLFYANPPRSDFSFQSHGKDVAIFKLEDADLECPVPICKLWARCSCPTGINPNYWCSNGIKKGLAESIRNSFFQVYEYLVLAKVGYGILTNMRHWYLVKRDHAGHFYISKCFNWGDTEPPLLAAIAYLVNFGVESRNEFDVPPKEGEVPWSWVTTPRTNPSGGYIVDKRTDNMIWKPNHDSYWRSRWPCSNLREDQLNEISASNLHLDDRPITTVGARGYVVGGTLNDCRVAVKFAPRNSQRSRALMNEVGAYMKLHEYRKLHKHWGDFVPVLVGHGTTANGQVVFIATELIDGSPLEAGNATKEVRNAAFRALNAVHACNLLHGNVVARNILVVQGTQPSVRLIDFSLAECNSDKTLQKEERQDLLNLFRYVRQDLWNLDRCDWRLGII